jgi:hypothetical protein
MTISPRWLCAIVAFTMILAGPFASWTAGAQGLLQQQQGSILHEPPSGSVEPTEGDAVAAGMMNVIYVPGKAIICTFGAVASFSVLVITLGSGYKAAKTVFNEGCGGDWVLTPEHLSGKIQRKPDTEY